VFCVERGVQLIVGQADDERIPMSHGWFGPCPHCHAPLSYLEGVSGSQMNPQCPRCHRIVPVTRATFLMADHSQPGSAQKKPPSRST
jgi:hypothetical protein